MKTHLCDVLSQGHFSKPSVYSRVSRDPGVVVKAVVVVAVVVVVVEVVIVTVVVVVVVVIVVVVVVVEMVVAAAAATIMFYAKFKLSRRTYRCVSLFPDRWRQQMQKPTLRL
ncbi:hypothetical protein ElyMa_001605600 [Elysia marginata]|uniref:Uncharacterized protein n=1 Tax=Elysia marginata TaxID=1093978 RepID=A0AAV4JHV5_9GAST|nr:hypothetical protein ElyMa_001605600 [Elysia marginata]